MKMAEHGLVSAPNMAVGAPFNIGCSGQQPVAGNGAGSLGLPVQGLVPGVPGVPRVPGSQGPKLPPGAHRVG
jgi:hypothetical protein